MKRIISLILKFILKRIFLIKKVQKQISVFGKYYLVSDFIFTDFKNWSTGHNAAFNPLVESCRNLECVLDVGAYVGLTTLPISRVLIPSGTVHAFEPTLQNVNVLGKHIHFNKISNIKVIRTLVGDREIEKVDFYESQRFSPMNSIVDVGKQNNLKKTTVPMVSIDEYCKKNSLSPQLIKVDVEGAEDLVLQGAKTTLSKCSPLVFLSIHPRHLEILGSSLSNLLDTIKHLGYTIYDHQMESIDDREVIFGEYILKKKL